MQKRRHTRRRHRRAFARNPISVRRTFRKNRHRRTFRRNPLPASMGHFMDSMIMPAAIGAAGAVGVDFIMAQLAPMLPASLSSGAMLPLVRIAAAIGLGYVVEQAVDQKTGEQVAAGGVLLAIYSAAKSFLATNAPTVPLARYIPMGYIGPARTMGYVRPRLGSLKAQRMALMRRRRRIAAMMPQGNGMGRFIAPTRNQVMRGGMGRYVN